MLFSQERHEATLRNLVANYGVQVELGTELRALEQDQDGVTVQLEKTDAAGTTKEETARFRWVVGTDGARGAVRKLLGLTFLGETTAQHMVVADVRIDGLPGYVSVACNLTTEIPNLQLCSSGTGG